MSIPDVRWEKYSHAEIADWANNARGAAVTEVLEARLKSVAGVLKTIADTMNGIMRRVDSGEWTGNAATLATQAMQVLRDFDDMMGHHGEMNSLAAYGQSDNSSWVKVSVPAVVDVRAPQIPTGGPIDVLNSTVDYHHQLRAAKDAEEQARQVMREYETMTVGRISALPPLSLPSQVVVAVSEMVPLVDPGPGNGPRDQQGPQQVDQPNDTGKSGPAVGEQQVPPGGNGSSGDGSAGSAVPATGPAGASGGQPPFVSAVSGGSAGEAARTGGDAAWWVRHCCWHTGNRCSATAYWAAERGRTAGTQGSRCSAGCGDTAWRSVGARRQARWCGRDRAHGDRWADSVR